MVGGVSIDSGKNTPRYEAIQEILPMNRLLLQARLPASRGEDFQVGGVALGKAFSVGKFL